MKNISLHWIGIILLTLIPFSILFGVGILWLLDNQWFYPWLGLATGLSVVGWGWSALLQRKRVDFFKKQFSPSKNWSPESLSAWKKVESLADEVDPETIPLDQWDGLKNLLEKVIQTVASHYHPESDHPELEMPVPQLLKVLELASIDLRKALVDTLPGSHILTINDLMTGQRLVTLSQQLNNLYRLISLGVNPLAALAREARSLVTGKITDASIYEIKEWLLKAYVKKVGYYAIELYSGSIILDEQKFYEFVSQSSQKQQEQIDKRDSMLEKEPLRFLVIGQVNSGKSSLINALFGEMKALTDVLPQTQKVDPYLLERDGMEQAIILDTAGYEDADNSLKPLMEIKEEVLRCDLILLVCSAQTATRQADRALLDGLRETFKETNRAFPPLIIPLTHIDMLRPFREWEPPYNIEKPQGTKEKMIRELMEIVSKDLSVDIESIIPLNLTCDPPYNLEEGLIPSLLNAFDDTKRMKYLRCLKEFKDTDYWDRIWQQAQQSGKLLVKTSFYLAGKAGKKVDQWSKEL